MSDVFPLIEFFTVDIIFLGILTLILLGFLTSLWQVTHFVHLSKCYKGWNRYFIIFDDKLGKTKFTGIIFLAAALGMLINLVADEVLDNSYVIKKLPYKYSEWKEEDEIKVKEFSKLKRLKQKQAGIVVNQIWKGEEEFKHFESRCDMLLGNINDHIEQIKNIEDINNKPLEEIKKQLEKIGEHAIKVEVHTNMFDQQPYAYIKKLCVSYKAFNEIKVQLKKTEYFTNNNKEDLKRNKKRIKGIEDFTKDIENQINGFYQHAYAKVLQPKAEGKISYIQSELLVIKLLRVIFFDMLLIFFVIATGLLVRTIISCILCLRKWLKLSTSEDGKERGTQGASIVILLLIYFLFIPLSLKLWTEQSKRYYKKLTHAYLVIAEDKNCESQCQLNGGSE